MSNTKRWNWLFLPVVFGIAFRVTLWFYWMPERNDWVRSHDNNPAAVAYGEGKLDGMSIIITIGPLFLSFICCAIGSAPRLRGVIVLGIIASIVTIIIEVVDVWLKIYFINFITIHVIATLVTCIVIIFYYIWRSHIQDSITAA